MDEIVDRDECAVCFMTEPDDMKECLTGTPKFAEYWGVLKSCDLKLYFISYHVLLDETSI